LSETPEKLVLALLRRPFGLAQDRLAVLHTVCAAAPSQNRSAARHSIFRAFLLPCFAATAVLARILASIQATVLK